MSRIVSVHSYRGGTGKSNTTANLATLIAGQGRRVGIVDTDIQSPGIHVLFGMDEDSMTRALNDYLWGECPIEQTAYDVTPQRVKAAGGSSLILTLVAPENPVPLIVTIVPIGPVVGEKDLITGCTAKLEELAAVPRVFVTARSGRLSPLKSATATARE